MWALRDIKHGKTHRFDTWEDLLNFITRVERANDFWSNQ